MSVIDIIVLIVFVIPAFVVASYHFFLGLLGIFLKKQPGRNENPQTRFAFLIPAHNEERGISATLESLLKELDYPKELFDIFVVADNCTDSTAEIARRYDVRVLERQDAENRGKGFALKYAIPIILEETKCDGILILDADCILDRHALRSFDARLSITPERPLQLNYVVDNPDESSLSYLLGIANCLENEFFYVPKDALGLFVMLRGTGMFLPRTVLRKYPWEAFSIVEDTDYTLQLLNGGVSAGFLGEAKVYSAFPAEQETLNVQRKRWIGGTLVFSMFRGAPLISRGLFTFRLRLLDAGFTLMILSRPLILFQLLLTTLCTVLLVFPLRTERGTVLLGVSLACWIMYGIYFSLGVFRLGLNRNRLKLMMGLPMKVFSYLGMSLRSLFGKASTTWDRTPR